MATGNTEDPTTRSEFAQDALGRRIGLTGAVTRYYPEGESQGGIGHYDHRDHLGSVRAIIDDAGSLEAAYAYDPWGRRTTLLGNPDEVDFGYTAHFTHHPTGLALAPYRAYDPDLGRWISRDPIGEAGGINLYPESVIPNNPGRRAAGPVQNGANNRPNRYSLRNIEPIYSRSERVFRY